MIDLIYEKNDISIKYRYKPAVADNDSLIVVFSGFGANGKYTYDFRNALSQSRSAIIWIEDSIQDHVSYYLGKGIDLSIQELIYHFILAKLAELGVTKDRCILFGCSKGGSAAIYYGLKYDFKNICVTVPQIDIFSYINGDIPVWKGHPAVVSHLIDHPNKENALKNLIIEQFSKDTNLDKNIYLLSSTKDDQFEGQVKPYLSMLERYTNFNLIMSESILVNKHTDVTRHNVLPVLGILYQLENNLVPQFGSVEIKGREYLPEVRIEQLNLVQHTKKILFKENVLFVEGVALFEGVECKNWSDIDYELELKSNSETIVIALAKTSKTETTLQYGKDSSIIYDKANFCTKAHQGLDLSQVPAGDYVLHLNVITKLQTESTPLNYMIDTPIFSENKVMKIYNQDNQVRLKVEGWEPNKQIDYIVSKLGKKIKSWLYKPNLVANHFKVKGFVFIYDIEVNSNSQEAQLFLFDKGRFYSDLIREYLEHSQLKFEVLKDKFVIKFSLSQKNDIYQYMGNILVEFYNYVEQHLDVGIFYNTIEDKQRKVVEKIRSKTTKIEVGFLVSDFRKWSLGELFEKMKKSEHFSPKIILVKETIVPSVDDARYLEQVSYFRNIDPTLIEQPFIENKSFVRQINNNFDIIFYQQPWDGMRYWLNRFYEQVLSCYVPYSFIIYDSYLDYSLPEFHFYLWKYFSQSIVHKKSHLQHEPHHINKIEVTGYPKLDVYQKNNVIPVFEDFKPTFSGKKIIYAPHHSFKGSILQIATFEWSGQYLLNLKDENLNNIWAFKPHGRFKHALVDHKYLDEDQASSYMQSWNTENSFIYDKGDYFDLFKDSDILITDCSSFLAEYFPTGKPIIWLKSLISKVEFNDFGKKLSTGFYCVTNVDELEVIYTQLMNGEDPLLHKRQQLIDELFTNRTESSTDKLYNILLEKICK